MIATDMTSQGSTEEKLRWAFKMFDQDESGCMIDEIVDIDKVMVMVGVVELREMMDIIGTVYELRGFPLVISSCPTPSLLHTDIQEEAREKAETTFVNLDLDGDGEITEDEFIKGCFNDEYFIKTMEGEII